MYLNRIDKVFFVMQGFYTAYKPSSLINVDPKLRP